MEFTELLGSVAVELGGVATELEGGVVEMVIPTVRDGETQRSQMLACRMIHGLGYAPDKRIIAIASIAGKTHKNTDLGLLLRENENLVYSKVSLDEENHAVVYAFSLFDSADLEELVYMVREVALAADRMEEIYFGGKDKN